MAAAASARPPASRPARRPARSEIRTARMKRISDSCVLQERLWMVHSLFFSQACCGDTPVIHLIKGEIWYISLKITDTI